jgi:hypothetical protein
MASAMRLPVETSESHGPRLPRGAVVGSSAPGNAQGVIRCLRTSCPSRFRLGGLTYGPLQNPRRTRPRAIHGTQNPSCSASCLKAYEGFCPRLGTVRPWTGRVLRGGYPCRGLLRCLDPRSPSLPIEAIQAELEEIRGLLDAILAEVSK